MPRHRNGSTGTALERTEFLHTRGFKDGKRSWIDVMPGGGPKMRITHEILEGLSSTPPPAPSARRKCIAWRYVGSSRRCAIFADETGFRTAKAPLFKPAGMTATSPFGDLGSVGTAGSLFMLAAGGTALVFLVATIKEKRPGAVLTPAQQNTLNSLNRARLVQGLPPLSA